MAVASMVRPLMECATCPEGHAGPVVACAGCGLLPKAPHRVWPGGSLPFMVDGQWAAFRVSVCWLVGRKALSLCPVCLGRAVSETLAGRGGQVPAVYVARRPSPAPAAASPLAPPDEDDDEDDEDETRRR